MQDTNPGGILLSMDGVGISFGDKAALRDVTFAVKTGEIFGFLGPSGAGKTTTIKLLTRQLRADKGETRLFGEPIAALRQDVFDRIGVLTDNSGLYERLTVRENLAVFADLKGLPHTVIDEALAAVGLSDDGKKAAKSLSRGMKQRLMLARAVLHKPALLFLDEPTASLDPSTTLQIHRLLRTLNEGGTTIFLTTHNMEEADKLCARVAFLDQGQIVACDTPTALKLSHAQNRIVVQTAEGRTFETAKSAQGLAEIAEKLAGETLLTIHSQEPNLEEVFLTLTGRSLS